MIICILTHKHKNKIKFHKNINLNELEDKVKNHIISMKILFIKLHQVNLTLKSLENDKDIERFKFLDKIFKILVCQIKEFPFLAKFLYEKIIQEISRKSQMIFRVFYNL